MIILNDRLNSISTILTWVNIIERIEGYVCDVKIINVKKI